MKKWDELNEDERSRSLEVDDLMGRLYKKLGELGCRGGLSIARVDDSERRLHNYGWGFILGNVTMGDYKRRLNEFFGLYKEESSNG